jgi:putative holliday junction resolvase
MARILAIDYGKKRVGLATTDPLQIIATALATIAPSQLLVFLQKYCTTEPVATIVVGMPSRLDGSKSHLTNTIKRLIVQLEGLFPDQKIIAHDERFTSKMALNSMIADGSSKKQRRVKENLDMVAATIILQSYLEQQSLTIPNP